MKRFRLACVVIGFAGFLILGTRILPKVGDPSKGIVAAQCRLQLESIFPLLVEYGRKNEEFPTDQNGRLDPKRLFQQMKVSESKSPQCPNRNGVDSYIFRRGLKPADLTHEWRTDIPWTVIAIDALGNHPITDGNYAGHSYVNILLSCNASTVSTILTTQEQNTIIQKLDNGETFENIKFGNEK